MRRAGRARFVRIAALRVSVELALAKDELQASASPGEWTPVALHPRKRSSDALTSPIHATRQLTSPAACRVRLSSEGGSAASLPYDEAPDPADRGDALAASAGSAKAIAFPSGSGTFTWRTPFE